MIDFGLLPPEINSFRMYAGPGPGAMLAAAAAWDGLAADLQFAASGHRSIISELTSGAWLGPASTSLLSAVTPFIAWLSASSDEAAAAAGQASAAASAFEAAFAATIPPTEVVANRALLAALIATNFFGQNTPAIAATEAQYAEFWAQDAAAMCTYADSSASAARLTEVPEPAEVANPVGVIDQAIAAIKAQDSVLNSNLNAIGAQLAPRAADLLETLSSPIDGQAVDEWLIANTPLDDIVPLYSKYLSPYISQIAALLNSNQAFGQVSSADVALANLGKGSAPAAQALGNAAKGAAGAVSKVSSVAVGTGKALPGGLSVPASWTTVGETAGGPGVSLANATTLPAAAEGTTKGLPTAPPFGRFVSGSGGRKTPAYGHRLTFMTKPPAAG
jgi:PPE-repeat protein